MSDVIEKLAGAIFDEMNSSIDFESTVNDPRKDAASAARAVLKTLGGLTPSQAAMLTEGRGVVVPREEIKDVLETARKDSVGVEMEFCSTAACHKDAAEDQKKIDGLLTMIAVQPEERHRGR